VACGSGCEGGLAVFNNMWNHCCATDLHAKLDMSLVTTLTFMLTRRIQHELELLKRHIIILKKVMGCGPIGIMKLSLETGIPDHLVRYSLRVLEQQGLIAPSTQGAIATKSAEVAYSEFMAELEKISEITEEIKTIGLGPATSP